MNKLFWSIGLTMVAVCCAWFGYLVLLPIVYPLEIDGIYLDEPIAIEEFVLTDHSGSSRSCENSISCSCAQKRESSPACIASSSMPGGAPGRSGRLAGTIAADWTGGAAPRPGPPILGQLRRLAGAPCRRRKSTTGSAAWR